MVEPERPDEPAAERAAKGCLATVGLWFALALLGAMVARFLFSEAAAVAGPIVATVVVLYYVVWVRDDGIDRGGRTGDTDEWEPVPDPNER